MKYSNFESRAANQAGIDFVYISSGFSMTTKTSIANIATIAAALAVLGFVVVMLAVTIPSLQ